MNVGRTFRLANGLGRCLEKAGVLHNGLTASGFQADIADVCESQQYEDLQLERPLQSLINASDSEADLSPIGKMATRRQIIELLENLTRLQRARVNYPGIANESIVAPVFITGLPRTGSTLLHSLIAQDQMTRVPETWEVMRPPVKIGSNAKGVRYTERRLRWAHRLAPKFRSIHPIGARLPQECIAITAYVFRSIVFHTTQHVPSYQDWFENEQHEIAYRFHRQFLQNLQFFGDTGKWVLKAPGHMFGIDDLLATYPDATIVQTHRDPLRVAASLASHTTVLRSAFSDNVNSRHVAADWLERWWRANDRLLKARAGHKQSFVDVYYSDIVRDPVGTIDVLYQRLGWTMSAVARRHMEAFLRNNPKDKHGEHHYTLGEFGLNRQALLERLDRYQSHYSIQEEPISV